MTELASWGLIALAALAAPPAEEFSVPAEGVGGCWQSREDKPGPGTTTVRTDSTIQFTLTGDYLIERKVTLDGQGLSHFKDKGRYRYTPTSKLEGELAVALEQGAGPFPPRGQVGKVRWVSADEWVYILGNHRVVYRRMK